MTNNTELMPLILAGDGYQLTIADEANDPSDCAIDLLERCQRERDEARGQRDRLAEALQKIRCLCRQEIPDLDCYCRDCEMLNTIDDALQSLTTKP
jgi:hypothetical protein